MGEKIGKESKKQKQKKKLESRGGEAALQKSRLKIKMSAKPDTFPGTDLPADFGVFIRDLRIDLHIERQISLGGFGFILVGYYLGKNVAVKVEYHKKTQSLEQP